jgi:hypothetical protein
MITAGLVGLVVFITLAGVWAVTPDERSETFDVFDGVSTHNGGNP